MFGSGSLRLGASLILALGMSVGCGGDEGLGRAETGGSGGSAGSGGSGGSTGGSGGSTGGSGGTTGGTGGSGGDACQKGTTKPSQVVWIGDSYPDAGNGGIQRYTEQSAQAAGVLAAGATYRRYYAGGTQMANGQIPGQYTTAKNADPNITTVIMTGGGNDILIGNATCLLSPPPANQSCVDTVNKAVAATEALLTQMQTDGVKNVIYYFYPRTTLAMSGANVDYAFPIVKAGCDKFTAPLKCTFIDTRPAFAGQMFIGPDGIHPNDGGQKAIGGLVWETMQSKCIGL
ncbi:MAG: SGNH/GDSL hydrolase family protein [Polyangiaceae bacterium]